jgi:hypothetical protein
MDLFVSPDGEIHCLYSEALDLGTIGQLAIRRASHVEPTASGQWTADLTPVSGPVLGPFQRRSDALAAEEAWINKQWLPSAQ